MNVQMVTDMHCESGIVAWEHFGRLTPKFWVQSARRRAVVEPYNAQSLGVDVTRGVMMIGFMCEIIGDARWIGRTVEAWSREVSDGMQIPVGGLEQIADKDPKVTTAIVAQGFDLLTSQTHTALASFTVNEHVEVQWKRLSDPELGDAWQMISESVQGYLLAERPKHSVQTLQEFIETCGWGLRVSD